MGVGTFNRASCTTAGAKVAFGSVGAAHGAVIDASGRTRKVIISSTLNQEVVLSFDGGTTDFLYIPVTLANMPPVVIDFDDSMELSGSIQVKHTGAAPTAGNLYVSVIKAA